MHLNPFTHAHPAGPLAPGHTNPLLGAGAFAPRAFSPPAFGDAGARIAAQVFGGRGGSALVPTGVVPGSYGGSSAIPVLTVDLYGRLVAVSTASIAAGIIPRGHIDGLTLSLNGSFANRLDIATGDATDSTGAKLLALGSVLTKIAQSSGSWTAGTNQNGLDTGAVAANTWYHVWLIADSTGATVDALFSLSATAPTMPTGYALKRRIGSWKTDGSSLFLSGIKQYGDTFLWNAPQSDVAATNPGTSAVTRTLSTPPGVRTCALVTVGFDAGATADNPSAILLSDLSIADTSPSVLASTLICYSGSVYIANAHIPAEVWTNTSAQIRSRLQLSSTNTTLRIQTHGWHDPRGRDGL